MPSPAPVLICGKRKLVLSQPKVMGILNITPDSFSDGGTVFRNGRPSLDSALRKAQQMVTDGASIIDVGGESTRPGAQPVTEQEELDRVIPVIQQVAANIDTIISVDTSRAKVIQEAVAAGAGFINDVRALTSEGAISAAAESQLPMCLMHMRGQPLNMQEDPSYKDVVGNVFQFLSERIQECERYGICRSQIIIDPGFGFGKTLAHNLALLQKLEEFKQLGVPLLVGLSRKSMLGELLGRPVSERLPGSLALAMVAAQRGAAIIRVHDVAATVDVLKVLSAISENLNS